MWLLALLGLVMTLPLAVRRRAPVTVVAIAIASLLGLDAFSEVQDPQITLLPVLVATFSAGAYAARRQALTAAAIALGGVLAAEPNDFIVSPEPIV